jgi:hypothetical protein
VAYLGNANPTGQREFYSVDIVNGKPLPKDRSVSVAANDGEVTMAGWAVDHQAEAGAGGVYVGIDGRKEVRAVYGLQRKDVASFYSNPRYAASGFVVSIPTSLMGKGRHTLTLKVIRADRQGYYETDQRIDVDVQ